MINLWKVSVVHYLYLAVAQKPLLPVPSRPPAISPSSRQRRRRRRRRTRPGPKGREEKKGLLPVVVSAAPPPPSRWVGGRSKQQPTSSYLLCQGWRREGTFKSFFRRCSYPKKKRGRREKTSSVGQKWTRNSSLCVWPLDRL